MPNDLQRDGNERSVVPELSDERFEEFHRETFKVVWAMARRLCGDDDEAHDVCQLAYLTVYDVWRRGELREPPHHLLLRVAQRRAVDAVRARSRWRRVLGMLPRPQASAGWGGPELRDALRRLPPDDAALLLLVAAGGYSYEEAGRISGRSAAAVRSRLFRARRRLRAELFGEEER